MLNISTLRASSRSILSRHAHSSTQRRHASSLTKILGALNKPKPPAPAVTENQAPSSSSQQTDAGPPVAGPDGYPPPQRTFARGWNTSNSNAFSEDDSFQELDGGEDGPDGGDITKVSITKLKLHCHSTPNNTITTLTEANGSTIAWFSGGSCGFRKGNRATYEAGYQCAVRAFKKIQEVNLERGGVAVELYFKGFGEGRNALKGALLATEGADIRGLVTAVTDRTPIKIGGTRAKKMPRN